MACLHCKNNQSEYYRNNSAPYSHKEIFQLTFGQSNSYDILKTKGTKWIMECLSCHCYWFVSVKKTGGGAIYTDFNREDPRDTAPDSYEEEMFEVEAKVVPEPKFPQGLKD